MTHSRKKKASTVLLAAYLSCLVLVEFTHVHHQMKTPETESFAVHSCGDVELHRPLDWIAQCALCRDGHGRLFAAVQEPSGYGLTLSPGVVLFPLNEALQSKALPHQGPARGPPAI